MDVATELGKVLGLWLVIASGVASWAYTGGEVVKAFGGRGRVVRAGVIIVGVGLALIAGRKIGVPWDDCMIGGFFGALASMGLFSVTKRREELHAEDDIGANPPA